jgi:hypothetical protein
MDPAPTLPSFIPSTILALVERAVRDWVRAIDLGDGDDPRDLGTAYRVFYMDAGRPNEIQTSGTDAARCGLRIRPSEVRSGHDGGTALLVDVTLTHRRDGEPMVIEFQVSLNDALKVVVH